MSDVFTDRHTAAQIKVYGEVNNEGEKDININDCNDCFDDRSYLYFRTIISTNRTGSDFPDQSCNLFYRNIAWMEKRNGVLCDLFIDRLSWSSGVFKFFGRTSKVIWTDRKAITTSDEQSSALRK